MSRVTYVRPFSWFLVALAISCARHTGATDGDVVPVDRTETPGVADACIRSSERFASRCGVDGGDDAKTMRDCKQLALTHGDGAIPWLACRAEASCEAPAAGCEQSSTFGDELCASPVMSCSNYCTDRFRLFLDDIAPRLKPALLAAAKTCASQKRCADAHDCMMAWVALID